MTSRTLVLLRHAKAEPLAPGGSDEERPLSARGRADAGAAGTWLAAHDLVPDLVLCSPARRTRQTWAAVAEAIFGTGAPGAGDGPPASYDPRLYSAGARPLLDLVAALPDGITTVLVVGHNPTLSIASGLLQGPVDGDDLRTAGLAVHTADLPWPRWGRVEVPRVMAHTARAVPA